MRPGWGARGHHWKLVAIVVVFGGIAYWVALMKGWLIASAIIMVGVATFLVQWFCIDTPGVEEKDRHEST